MKIVATEEQIEILKSVFVESRYCPFGCCVIPNEDCEVCIDTNIEWEKEDA